MTLAQLDLTNENVNPLAKFTDISKIANVIVTVLVSFAGLTALILSLIGAFTILTASGEPEKFQKGKKILANAIFGFLIVLVSFLVIKLLEYMLGIKIIL